MHRTLIFFLILGVDAAPVLAQGTSPDTQVAQTLLAEIRELRQDLANTAAMIQRAQIAIYRLQTQSAVLDKAEQRFDQARSECKQFQMQQQVGLTEIEQADARRRSAPSASEQRAAEQLISQLQLSAGVWASQVQQCQAEQADSENQLRVEQAKMNQLQEQLDRLDQVLLKYKSK